jgi:hypothetical protein
MSITLTANYRDVLAAETVQYIETRLLPSNYDLEAALVFIDENGEDTFNETYELYIELGEQYGFEAVDCFLKEVGGPDELEDFPAAYIGEYFEARYMAEEFFSGDGDVDRLDYRIVIDWEATAEYLLNHEVDRYDDFFFRCSY